MENGNTALIELPFWVAEVAEVMAEARAIGQAEALRSEEEARKLLGKLGTAAKTYNANLQQKRSNRPTR